MFCWCEWGISQLKLCRPTTCWQKVCEGSAKTCHTGLHWVFKVWGGPTGNSNFDTFKIKGNASGKNPTLSLYCACHRLDSLSLLKKPEDTCVAIPVKTCSQAINYIHLLNQVCVKYHDLAALMSYPSFFPFFLISQGMG